MALHAGRARRRAARLRPWITLVVLDGGRVRRGAEHRRPPAAVHHDRRRRRVLPPADELWAWAHVHFNQRARRHGRRAASRPTWAPCCRASQAMLAAEPGPRLLAARLPAPARRQHRLPRVRRPDLRDRPARRARPGSRRRRRTRRTRPGPTTPASPSRRSLPVLLPLVLPHRRRTATSSTSCALLQAAARRPARRHARHRRAGPGLEPARRSTTTTSAACCGSAARCRSPTTTSTPDDRDRARAYENWDAALSARRSSTRWPRSSTCPTTTQRRRPQRERGDRPRRRRRRRSRSADHRAALRPLARAHAAAADRTRRHAAPTTTTNWVHRLNLDPRFRVPAGFGTDVVAGRTPEEYMDDAWQQIGDVLEANARIRAAAARAPRSRSRWYDRHLTPLAAAAAGAGARARRRPVAARVILDAAATAVATHARDEPRRRRC